MLVTNEESPLVEEIFRRYATGKDSLGDLRKILNEAGYLKSSAAVSYILKSQVYLGLVPHGRYSRSQFMPKPEITWVQGMHEALVDQELFDRVQSRLAGNVNRNRGGSHPRYLFSSLIHCANCGYKFAGRSQASNPSSEKLVQYRCSRRTSFGDCHSHSVQETRIRAAVIPPIESLLGKLRQEDIRVAVREELAGQRESVKAAQRQTTEGMTESQRRLEGRLSRLEDRYLDGDLSQERYLIRRDEFMAQLKEIQKDLATKPQPVLPDIDRVFSIAESITMEDLDDQAWREIIEAMVDRISIEGSATKTDGRRSPATIRVLWKSEYEPLLALAGE